MEKQLLDTFGVQLDEVNIIKVEVLFLMKHNRYMKVIILQM